MYWLSLRTVGRAYHHRLHQSDLLAVMHAIPTVCLQGGVVHAKRVDSLASSGVRYIQGVLPAAGAHVVTWGVLVAGRVGPNPEERHVASTRPG